MDLAGGDDPQAAHGLGGPGPAAGLGEPDHDVLTVITQRAAMLPDGRIIAPHRTLPDLDLVI